MRAVELPDESATRACGRAFVEAGLSRGLVFLEGELGAGKTTWVRGCLEALGVAGHVRSPTFTLVESYPGTLGPVHHLDLYRLADVEELEYLGVRDLVGAESLCLVEWPERGGLTAADLRLTFSYRDHGRRLAVAAREAAWEDLVRRGLARTKQIIHSK